MSQTGFTPIQLYRTSTAATAPAAGNLADGELAINTTDEKLYFKNAGGTVKLLAANVTPVANGGTGTTSLTANNVLLGNGTSAPLTVAPGTSGNVLTSNGTTWTSATAASLSGVTQSASPFETSLGYQAGNATTGVNNTFVGYQTGLSNSSGTDNTAIGFNALISIAGDFGSTAVGSQALRACTGNQNTAVGADAGRSINSGTQNTVIGFGAGWGVGGTGAITTGQNNIVIGYNAIPSSPSVNGETTIGTSDTLTLRAFGTLQTQKDYQEKVVTANTGTAYTINLANGTVQILTLTGNVIFTFPTATAGKSFMLLLKQDATGSRTATWPASVKWPGGTAPTITATASKLDKYIFTADGTNWYGSNGGQNYTV